MTRILRNMARCLNCNSLVESKYLGDFRNCSCGELGINGGLTQLIRQSNYPSRWVELSVLEETSHDAGSRGEAGTRRPAVPADTEGDGGGGEGRPDVPVDGVPRGKRRRPDPGEGE